MRWDDIGRATAQGYSGVTPVHGPVYWGGGVVHLRASTGGVNIYHSPYVQCPACGKIIPGSPSKLIRPDEPAPCCGATGEARLLWPSLEVHHFLELVHKQNLDSTNERRVAIVFLATVLELLLENVLWELVRTYTDSHQLAEYLFDTSWGKERRIRLYDKLSDRPLGELLQENGMGEFLKEWGELSSVRNKIVHGRYYASVATDADLIRHLSRDALKAFTLIHNEIQVRTRSSSQT